MKFACRAAGAGLQSVLLYVAQRTIYDNREYYDADSYAYCG